MHNRFIGFFADTQSLNQQLPFVEHDVHVKTRCIDTAVYNYSNLKKEM